MSNYFVGRVECGECSNVTYGNSVRVVGRIESQSGDAVKIVLRYRCSCGAEITFQLDETIR